MLIGPEIGFERKAARNWNFREGRKRRRSLIGRFLAAITESTQTVLSDLFAFCFRFWVFARRGQCFCKRTKLCLRVHQHRFFDFYLVDINKRKIHTIKDFIARNSQVYVDRLNGNRGELNKCLRNGEFFYD